MIVAHPDDETLWAGGLMLMHPGCTWTVVSVCRASDRDRAPKFFRAMQRLGASGQMDDLDDSPEQYPLTPGELHRSIFSALPPAKYDLILTHGLRGEYTRHRRHEEVSQAVVFLWENSRIKAEQLWMFAYEDGGKSYLPRSVRNAHYRFPLPDEIWEKKYRVVTEDYGFEPDTFEARTTPREEAFWCFGSPAQLRKWMDKEIRE